MPQSPFKIIADGREKIGYTFTGSGHPVETGTLATGDYSIKGLENYIAFERKEAGDFVACCGHERERFVRELQRLRAYRYRGVVIEASMEDIAAGRYRSNILPQSVLGSIAGFSLRFEVPIFLCGDREHGERFTLGLLRNAHRQLAELVDAIKGTG